MTRRLAASRRVKESLDVALRMGEVGIQVAAYAKGQALIDECAGVTEEGTNKAVGGGTLFPVFSVTKAVAVTALHLQAERGLIDYAAPVGRYWPEYAVNGKEHTLVSDVLAHRAGVPQMPEGVTTQLMCDWEWMIRRLSEARPLFPPGTTSAYHSLTFGWLVGELVRRTDAKHRSLGRFIQEEICQPLQISDLYIGLPTSEDSRVATLTSDLPRPVVGATGLHRAAIPDAVDLCPEIYNRPSIWHAEVPGTGGITNASSLARFFALLANSGELDGVRLLSEERILRCTRLRPIPHEVDRVNGSVRWIGLGGYWVAAEPPMDDPILGSVRKVLYHPGAGGSIAWADLDRGLAVAICHNRMVPTTLEMELNPIRVVAEAVRTTLEEFSR